MAVTREEFLFSFPRSWLGRWQAGGARPAWASAWALAFRSPPPSPRNLPSQQSRHAGGWATRPPPGGSVRDKRKGPAGLAVRWAPRGFLIGPPPRCVRCAPPLFTRSPGGPSGPGGVVGPSGPLPSQGSSSGDELCHAEAMRPTPQ